MRGGVRARMAKRAKMRARMARMVGVRARMARMARTVSQRQVSTLTQGAGDISLHAYTNTARLGLIT